MRISTEPLESCSILHLKGEFGTLDCTPFVKEIESLGEAGVQNVVLNLRLTKYINSTALGAIIKAHKIVAGNGGKLVISRPSAFCRNAITGVGLEAMIPLFEDDDIAVERLDSAAPAPLADDATPLEEENSTVLFSPVDQARAKRFVAKGGREASSKRNWHGVGNMVELDTRVVRFFWDGGTTGLSAAKMNEMFSPGIELKVKFRLPLLQRGYREAVAIIGQASEQKDGVLIVATFKEMDAETVEAVEQYAEDMAYLKDELHQVTANRPARGESAS